MHQICYLCNISTEALSYKGTQIHWILNIGFTKYCSVISEAKKYALSRNFHISCCFTSYNRDVYLIGQMKILRKKNDFKVWLKLKTSQELGPVPWVGASTRVHRVSNKGNINRNDTSHRVRKYNSIDAKIIFTVKGLTLSYQDFPYNGEKGIFCSSKRGLNGSFSAT